MDSHHHQQQRSRITTKSASRPTLSSLDFRANLGTQSNISKQSSRVRKSIHNDKPEDIVERSKKTQEAQQHTLDIIRKREQVFDADVICFPNLEAKIKWERCMDKIQRLLSSPRNDMISQTLNNRAFLVRQPGRVPLLYTGLKERQKQHWWPNTEENPFRRTQEDRKSRSTTKYHTVKQGKPVGCKHFGAKHGSTVHEEMEMFFKAVRTGKIDHLRDLDPCTCRLIFLIHKYGWIPIASEFRIWEEDWRVATSIDMLVYCPKRCKLFIVEFKTGYESEEYKHHPNDKRLPQPFHKLPNCPLVRHQFQLLGMVRILHRKYGVMVDDGYILRSCPKAKGSEKKALMDWCKDLNYIHNFDIGMLERNVFLS